MADAAPLRVQVIAKTEFFAPPDVSWSNDADGCEALVEFAGRACYQSWSKPNPKTATNAGYLRHIIDVGHFSVLEHASVSFYITSSRCGPASTPMWRSGGWRSHVCAGSSTSRPRYSAIRR